MPDCPMDSFGEWLKKGQYLVTGSIAIDTKKHFITIRSELKPYT